MAAGVEAEPGQALRRLWAPYAAQGLANVATYTEPLFFRDPRGVYLRNVYVNERSVTPRDLAEKLPVAPDTPLEACYHYLSSGEMQASISLLRLFQELGLSLDLRNSRLSTLGELRHANLILLGSVRTNPLIDQMNGGPGFVMTHDSIENKAPRPGEQDVYRGSRYMDGKLLRCTDFALVTRRRGLLPGTALTIVASHHGRAVQGVGTLLTIEAQVAALLRRLDAADNAPLPDHFQILMQVEMMDLDAEVVEVRYLTHRTFNE